ncbi:MAG: hypothetical protein OEZ65_15115, partial [Gemmatimonadota bacterium]|nr:hypothetical protein [Gemmatimonadota bacterium]
MSTRCSACRTVFRVERPEPEVEAPPPPPVEASDSGPSTSLRVPGRTDPLADAIAPYLVKDRREPEPEPEPQFVPEPEPEPE